MFYRKNTIPRRRRGGANWSTNNAMRNKSPRFPSNRKFGLTIAIALIVIAVLPLVHHGGLLVGAHRCSVVRHCRADPAAMVDHAQSLVAQPRLVVRWYCEPDRDGNPVLLVITPIGVMMRTFGKATMRAPLEAERAAIACRAVRPVRCSAPLWLRSSYSTPCAASRQSNPGAMADQMILGITGLSSPSK